MLRFCFFLVIAPLCFGSTKFLPENRNYVEHQDIGMSQYTSPGLFFTGKYVLTFDDGPHEELTPKLLDILKKHNVKATFFIVTSRLDKKTTPIILRAIREGHIVASHHHSHDHNNHKPESLFRKRLVKSLKAVLNLYRKSGMPLTHLYYRFPYGEYGKSDEYHHLNVIREVSHELFSENCIRFAFWDHDSSDWVPGLNAKNLLANLNSITQGGQYWSYKIVRERGKKRIKKKKIENYFTQYGGVILLHDIQKHTPKAIDHFLKASKKNKIDFVNLSETPEYQDFSKSCVQSFN